MTRPPRGMTWDEIDRLRRLVPLSIDRHLANWARWARAFRVEIGHRSRSIGFSGTGMSSAEDLEAEVDAWSAEVADDVQSTMAVEMRNAIAAVYAGGAWHLRADLLAPTLIEAAGIFWQQAKRRGLM